MEAIVARLIVSHFCVGYSRLQLPQQITRSRVDLSLMCSALKRMLLYDKTMHTSSVAENG